MKDSIPLPVYDTSKSINLRSTNSFYFCNKLYSIPRMCEQSYAKNCCSFSSSINAKDNKIGFNQLACYDGSTLFWDYRDTEEEAQKNMYSYLEQMNKQARNFEKEKIEFFVCGKTTEAYKLKYTNDGKHAFTEIVFYQTINGVSFSAQLDLGEKVATSGKEMNTLFQQLFKF